jgi:exonuclease III
LKDPDKLAFIAFTLIQQRIHVACLTESRIRRNDLMAALRSIGLDRQFRAFGLNGQISWLVREPVAEKVVSRLDYEGGRISGLVLAGSCKQRTILLGVYGHAGASTDNQKAQRQKGLWSQLAQLIQANRDLGHHMVVLGDFNVLPSVAFTTSRKALTSSIEDFLTWQTNSGLSNVLLQAFPDASLFSGFFTRSRTSQHGVELSLIDHVFATPGLANGSGILILPSGAVGRTDRLGDHDAVVADLDLGFQPAPPLAKRQGIVWAHHYSPKDWNQLNTDHEVLDTIDTLLIELETAGESIGSEALSRIFERILAISSPARAGSNNTPMLSMPADDPIFLAIGRMLGRLKTARSYVRSHLPRARQTYMRSRFDRHHAYALVFHVEDKWAETLADTADMRRSLRFNHCHTGADWLQWLYTLGKVIQRLHRIAKHHRKLWKTSRREFEVAKATQEGRAGKLRRAMDLIFPASSPGVADNAYWRKAKVVGPQGSEEEVWLFETDPTMVEEEALRHVQNLFPQPLGWRPEVRGATFPDS